MNATSATTTRDPTDGRADEALDITEAEDRHELIQRLRTQSQALAELMDEAARRQREVRALRSALSAAQMRETGIAENERSEAGQRSPTDGSVVETIGPPAQSTDLFPVDLPTETGDRDTGSSTEAIIRCRFLVMKRRAENAEDKLSRANSERDRSLLIAASTQGSLETAQAEIAELARSIRRSESERWDEVSRGQRSIETRLESIEARLGSAATGEGIDLAGRVPDPSTGPQPLRLPSVHRILVALDRGSSIDVLPHMQGKVGVSYEDHVWKVHRGSALAFVLHGPYLKLQTGRYVLHVDMDVSGTEVPELLIDAVLHEGGMSKEVGSATAVTRGRLGLVFSVGPGCEDDEVEFRFSHDGRADFILKEILLTRIV